MKLKKTGEAYSLVLDTEEKYLCNPQLLHENRLAPRATVIPSDKEKTYFVNKEVSPYIISLNGICAFKYCQKAEGGKDYYSPDADDTSWDKTDIPSMWQYRGYGACKYPNVEYPFPYNPPFVPEENPFGVYRIKFNIKKPKSSCILHFCGVDNAFFAYLNGEYVGFSKGSRCASEFDVTGLVKKGENLLAVKVYSRSDSSYIENQDMLLANGIFRDVYLICTEKTTVWDYSVVTSLSHIKVDVKVNNPTENTRVKISVDGVSFEKEASENASHSFEITNPRLWSAEEPNLYDLKIELFEKDKLLEVHSKRVGLTESETNGNKLLVNKKQVMLKGINRHEYNCHDGRYVKTEQIEKELKLIKECNLNAIRCAHYTNIPSFYEIATELGIYVMDEADIETHGAEQTGDQGALSKNPEWLPAYLDRTERMAVCNKNETCVTIYSIGNECGCGENLKKCAEYLRSLENKKPIHQTQDGSLSSSYDDFRKNGYCPVSSMNNYPPDGKPIVLTEFAHGMGNGPGFLGGYFDYMYSHDGYCGGFVWELKNHGFYAEDKNKTPFYKYGGDLSKSEYNHWRNFTLDGYLRSDLTPKPSYYELKEATAPVKAEYDRELILENRFDFLPLSVLSLSWELLRDFTVTHSGKIASLPNIMPRERGILHINELPTAYENGYKYRLNLTFFRGDAEICKKQLLLCDRSKLKKAVKKPITDVKISAKSNRLKIAGENFTVSFENGVICEYTVKGEKIVNSPMEFCFYRALTDNDCVWHTPSNTWTANRLNNYGFYPESFTANKQSDCVEITSIGKCTANGRAAGYKTEMTYSVFADGKIAVNFKLTPYGNLPKVLLRTGVFFKLDKACETALWYGRGKNESYPDKKLSSPFGLYRESVENMFFKYDYPQESGNMSDVFFASAQNQEKTKCFSVSSSSPFNFSYHDFSVDMLENAQHVNELKSTNKCNYFHIDFEMRGLGSHSCGPDPEPEFELHPKSIDFKLVFSAEGDPEELLTQTKTEY